MSRRTRVYIAGDWDGDSDLIETLYAWKRNSRLEFSFADVHEWKQARDESLPCSIKESLSKRMDIAKTFVLIVGKQTKTVTKGRCQYCRCWSPYENVCFRGRFMSKKSFIDFECDKAIRDGLTIVVIYNAMTVNREACPEAVRYEGHHIPAIYKNENGEQRWNYNLIKDAIMNA